MNEIIATDKGPGALGPYSQAVKTAGGLLFVSGQIPLVPATGEIVAGGIEEQTVQVLENIKAIVWRKAWVIKLCIHCLRWEL